MEATRPEVKIYTFPVAVLEFPSSSVTLTVTLYVTPLERVNAAILNCLGSAEMEVSWREESDHVCVSFFAVEHLGMEDAAVKLTLCQRYAVK